MLMAFSTELHVQAFFTFVADSKLRNAETGEAFTQVTLTNIPSLSGNDFIGAPQVLVC